MPPSCEWLRSIQVPAWPHSYTVTCSHANCKDLLVLLSFNSYRTLTLVTALLLVDLRDMSGHSFSVLPGCHTQHSSVPEGTWWMCISDSAVAQQRFISSSTFLSFLISKLYCFDFSMWIFTILVLKTSPFGFINGKRIPLSTRIHSRCYAVTNTIFPNAKNILS